MSLLMKLLRSRDSDPGPAPKLFKSPILRENYIPLTPELREWRNNILISGIVDCTIRDNEIKSYSNICRGCGAYLNLNIMQQCKYCGGEHIE